MNRYLYPISIARYACAALLCASMLAGSAHARESDFTQPIDIDADRIEFDEKSGVQVWSGNVVLSQGTMRINAERIAITLVNKQLSRIEGSGAPIKFQQENEAGELVTGQADAIDYDAVGKSLVLKGSATLQQPGQRLKSERIVFDSTKQKISAEGGDKGRVSIRIQPPTPSK